ncbi:LCP family protein [Natribacillus halophilus]|uniref:Cell envelope-related function transcriptional attenuator common domain-containing protein n=1 Tax=Natribacillus halophilus TaxID=549003 RepID=A0A1G8KG41_9BACI|nr:LCP family protein [Natribacillus halophilus]SDI42365.1 cell envelope-related function transcriptional attenuator common domain-containing protein [Natribacillus halophilus]
MKKALIILGIAASVLILAAGGFALYLYFSVTSTADEMHSPIEREFSELRPEGVNVEEEEPLSFLLLGVDAEDETSGRTDTIIVMTVNPEDESMKMLSIPRDTLVDIVGRDGEDKINHAYAFGGAEMAINTVENFLDVPIDYVATINMDGFEEMVDAVGGVTVSNEMAFEQGGTQFSEGDLELDGEDALSFVRMRDDDPRGDAGRNDRQREVIEGVLAEGAQLSSVTRVGSILDSVGSNVETNAEWDDITDMIGYESSRHDIEQMTLSGEGTRIDGIYYELIDDGEVAEASQELREHLELE